MTPFDHIKTILAIILGLSIAHLLKGIIKFVQHPKLGKPYWVHLLWCIYVFLLITHFWWWEFHLRAITDWNFEVYFFLICYASVYYFVCSLLLPENVDDYNGYADYFYSRKKWIFGLLALTFALDFIDTLIKGKEYYIRQYNWEYPARNISHIILFVIAINVSNKKFHGALVVFALLYELSYIYRLFMQF